MRATRGILNAVCVALLVGCPRLLACPLDQPTQRWDELLRSHVNQHGGVDYAGFQGELGKLREFIGAHAKVSLVAASDDCKKATYINLYNATMIDQVLTYAAAHALRPSSPEFLILAIDTIHVPGGNLWNGDRTVNLAGHEVKLDDLEHQLLRGDDTRADLLPLKVRELDPRLHAAVNCAARSCPRLRNAAWQEATLAADLQAAMQDFMSDDQQFQLSASSRLQANSIVFWYYADFDDYAQAHGLPGAGDYLASFMQPATPAHDAKVKLLHEHMNGRSKLALRFSRALKFKYDWRVNDALSKP